MIHFFSFIQNKKCFIDIIFIYNPLIFHKLYTFQPNQWWSKCNNSFKRMIVNRDEVINAVLNEVKSEASGIRRTSDLDIISLHTTYDTGAILNIFNVSPTFANYVGNSRVRDLDSFHGVKL